MTIFLVQLIKQKLRVKRSYQIQFQIRQLSRAKVVLLKIEKEEEDLS